MIKHQIKVGLVLVAMSLFIGLPGAGCTPDCNFDSSLSNITRPYRFGILKWEFDALGAGVRKAFFNWQEKTEASIGEVAEYFSVVERIIRLESAVEAIKSGDRPGDLDSIEAELTELRQQNAAATDAVERLLETQVKDALSGQGIYHPIDKYVGVKVGFPPVNIRLVRMPYLLVISPRDRIENIREVVLLPDITVEVMENIEAEVDKLGVSSLVVALGGLSTYPSLVTDQGDLRFTLNAAAEEWLHQYLAFKPLGFLYVLDSTGIRRSYEIATMNETLAGIVSKEIGAIVYESNYARDGKDNAVPETTESGFDFNQEMREIRKTVDSYLARGEIEQAKEFMEQRRQYLATKGYYIRKLNQAYFAFHGTYADRPDSISPIGAEMHKLRNQSASLKEFLEKAAAMTSRQDLAESVR